MSAERVFLDTNILVYANDSSDRHKSGVARELITLHLREGTGYLSAQVLGEFWVTITRKIASPLPFELAERQVRLLDSFTIVPQDSVSVWKAIELQKKHTISFWDAHILASALIAGCRTLYSEDLQDQAEYSGIKVVNPFAGSAEHNLG